MAWLIDNAGTILALLVLALIVFLARAAYQFDAILSRLGLQGKAICPVLRYTDRVEIRAGWITPFIWLWANAFYAHRQRKWITLPEKDESF
ncbi:MAG: hypothetical protein E7425_10385 [Ruminococcaceae bacterium]|nr:hypothetical protein [Oscillospiraceae bacterium]